MSRRKRWNNRLEMISEDSAGKTMIASKQKAIKKQSSPSELLKVVFEKNL